MASNSLTESEKRDSMSFNEVMDQPPKISETSMNVVSSILNQFTLGREPEFQQDCEEEENEAALSNAARPRRPKLSSMDAMKEYHVRRKLGDLLCYMMQHLIVNEPDDPVTFLQQLMDKCLMFRAGVLCDAPLLFEDRHIVSMYSSFDPLETGSITDNQYHVAMLSLGLKEGEYEMNPERLAGGNVAKETFITNAKMALVEAFMDMILLPPPYSDGDTSSIETFYH